MDQLQHLILHSTLESIKLPFLRQSKAKFAGTPPALTMVPATSSSPSYLETWIAWPQAIVQTIFMVWLSNSALCGQFHRLCEFIMLPVHVILIDLQRNQYNEAQPCIRSGADLGTRRCNFLLKSMHLYFPHHLLVLHLPCTRHKGKWKWKECWIMVSNWVRQTGHEIKGAGTSQAIIHSLKT
jgi:hypothetical protein